MKKAEEIRSALKKNRKLQAIKEQELADGRQELAELEKTWRNYEKQVQQEGAFRGRDVELDKDQASVSRYTIYFQCVILIT